MDEVIVSAAFYAGIGIAGLFAIFMIVRSLPFVVYYVFGVISEAGARVRDMRDGIAESFNAAQEEAETRKRHRDIEDEITYRFRPKKSFKPDERLIQLRHESDWIREGFKAYRESVSMCVDTRHIYKDIFTDVERMDEFENEPEIRFTQQRVLDFTDVLLERLNASEMTICNPELLSMRLGLRVMREVCENCELMRYSTRDVPRLCSVARWVQYKPIDKPIEGENGH